ncbi:hypothetical protein JTB14_024440 [Gonioctena quinquepunctata]|nr:hypothetical protein JTB14_024440 [Gonioctena quinquepunctata]
MNFDQLELLCSRPHNSGTLTDICPHCGALFYTYEHVNREQIHTNCCARGVFTLPALRAYPPALKDLYTGDGPMAIQFRRRIRYINSLFAMASFKTSRPIPERRGQGLWSFTICGQIYHFLDNIPNTQDLVQPCLNKIYFLDVEDALMRRNSFAKDMIDPTLMRIIELSLRNVNPYIQAYKTMGDELNERRAQNLEVENIVIGMTKDPVINILAARQDPT